MDAQGDPLFDELLNAADARLSERAQGMADQNAAGKSFWDKSGDAVKSAGAGAWKSFFETKDFLLGEPNYQDKSQFRQWTESTAAELERESALNGIVRGVSQFGTGMVGLGKILEGVQIASKGGQIAKGILEAATVGAVAFDPHEERLSNLVQSYPKLANPITDYLAADPKDSNAEGRFKAALESIGMDLALVGLLGASMKAYKFAKVANDPEGLKAALKELRKAQGEFDIANAPAVDNSTVTIKDPNGGPGVNLAPDPSVATIKDPNGGPGVNIPVGGETMPVDTPSQTLRDGSKVPVLGPTSQANPPAADLAPGTVPIKDPNGGMGVNIPVGGPTEPIPTRAGPEAEPSIIPADGGASLAPSAPVAGDPKPIFNAPSEGPRSMALETGATGDSISAVPEGVRAASRDLKPASERFNPMVAAGEIDVADVVKRMGDDMQALRTYGSRDAAVTAGYRFQGAELIPWSKMASPEDLKAFTGQIVKRFEDQLQRERGGNAAGIMSDARVDEMVHQRAVVFNEDPDVLLGMIQSAGNNARSMVANMEAGYLLTNKAFQDAFLVAQKIKAGNLAEWGGDAVKAGVSLKQQLAVATQLFNSSRAMTAAAGRSLRRMRGQFRVKVEDLQHLNSLDPETLATIINGTEGNPEALIRVSTSASLLGRVNDFGQFLLVNNMLWNWPTHVANLLSNGYMLASRPLEKFLGSTILSAIPGDAGRIQSAVNVRRQAVREWRATTSAMYDGLRSVLQAAVDGDSVLTPHATKTSDVQMVDQAVPTLRPVRSLKDLLSNAWSITKLGAGMPTRFLTVSDELFKQTRYRTVVASDASMEADELGMKAGTQAYKDFIKRRLDEAFDETGAAINPRALQETLASTFQSPLLSSGTEDTWGGWMSFGRAVQSIGANVPPLRFVVPFVKTPANLFRYGVKLSPGLNLLQKEYNNALRGLQGPEAQAQAVGQMALGSLWMGVAASMVANQMFTGAGSSDPKQRAQDMARGWRPYSFTWVGKDGVRNYIPMDRMDPIAGPLGIIADIHDVWVRSGDEEAVSNMATQVFLNVAHHLVGKTYLIGLSNFLDAIEDPERFGTRFAANLTANIATPASLFKMVNPDPYLRETWGFVDTIRSKVPGLSQDLPPRRDIFGDPIEAVNNLYSTQADTVLNRELDAMAAVTGGTFGPPSYVQKGVDLRQITLENGRNAYDYFQEAAGHPKSGMSLKDRLAKVVQTAAYQKAPYGGDDPSGASTRSLPGTKQAILLDVINAYRTAAFGRLQSESPTLRKAIYDRAMSVRAAYAGGRQDAGAKGASAALNQLFGGTGMSVPEPPKITP